MHSTGQLSLPPFLWEGVGECFDRCGELVLGVY